jgi:hypothetical protein
LRQGRVRGARYRDGDDQRCSVLSVEFHILTSAFRGCLMVTRMRMLTV